MARIYVSVDYSSKSADEYFERLVTEFGRFGHKLTRLDPAIAKEPDVSFNLAAAIQSSDLFIALITGKGPVSRAVNYEMKLAFETGYASAKQNFIVPLLHKDAVLPEQLKGIAINYFDSNNLGLVVRSIHVDLLEQESEVGQSKDSGNEEIKQEISRPQKASKKAERPSDRHRTIQLQEDLKALGYKVFVDGIMGGQTLEAIKRFQKEHDLEVTGEPDERTLSRIAELLKPEVQETSATRNYWLIAIGQMGSHSIQKGVAVDYLGAGEEGYNVSAGDMLIGIDVNDGNKAVCSFRAGERIISQGSDGPSLSLIYEDIFTSPTDLSIFTILDGFLNALSDSSAPRLLRVAPELYEEIMALGKQAAAATPRSLLHSAAARLHSDDSDPEDQLQYEMYAEAIASIIRDSKTSPPPLNIAIIAPWGQGKTTLMRYIRKRFPQKEYGPDTNVKGLTFGALAHWFGSSWKWVRTIREILTKGGVDPAVEELRKGIWKPESLEHPTVWFNPWRYQSSDQIWAGLGHAMITQLVAKLPPIHREQFWLRLRMKRIDGTAIRKDIHKRLFEQLLPVLLGGLVMAGMLVAGFAFDFFDFSDLGFNRNYAAAATIGGPAALFAYACFTSIRNFFSKSLEGKFATYVREPSYSEKLGLFHEINEDLHKVCNELISKEHPAIIFIDDLDRCSPKVVTEVIEAINLMMTSDFRDRCYFVFGMDAQMVSAALDAQYGNMAGKFADKEKIHGSVGWYFLDKFIQLPFFIPVLNPADKQSFLRKFFFENTPTEQKPKEVKFQQQEIATDAAVALEDPEYLEVIREKYAGNNAAALQSEMTRTLMRQAKDSTDIVQEVINYATYLDGSPRGLKRFANLLRFYHTQQQMRKYFPTSSASGSTATTKSLAKWLVINLRWPQMVRWVQWEYEELLLHSAEPEVKAKHIDGLITTLGNELKNGDDPYKKWLELLAKNDTKDQKKCAHLKWLHDRDLFLLLHENKDEDSSLEKALQYDVW